MNKFVSFGVLMCVLALANAAATSKKESSSSEENFKEIAEGFKEKFNSTFFLDILEMVDKVQEKCPEFEKSMESAAEKVYECLDEIEYGSQTLCSLLKNNWSKCTKPLREVAVSCLPKESQDLPGLVDKIVVGIIEQTCASTVEELLELFNPCMFDTDPQDFPACKEVVDGIVQHKHQLPSKALLCRGIPKTRHCVEAAMAAGCKNPVTKSTASKFHNAIERSIKHDCDALNVA